MDNYLISNNLLKMETFMEIKQNIKMVLLAAGCMYLPSGHADYAVSGAVDKVWAEQGGFYGRTGPVFVTLSSDPSNWVHLPPSMVYPASAMAVFKATNFGADSNQYLTFDVDEAADRASMFLAKSDVNTANNSVTQIFSVNTNLYGIPEPSYAQPNYTWVSIVGAANGGGLATSTAQAAVAAAALAENLPVNWEKGCISFFNLVTRVFEQTCDALQYIELQ